ncbi:MAG TPA: phospho-N-acetylmuramoyl-pentapeptide-transferase [Clostridia bacterium]
MSLILGPLFIPALTRLKFGQTVRDDGPKTHFVKKGTPTMGGIIFLIPVTVVGIYFSQKDLRILPLLFVTLGFGIIGFLDDFIKVIKKRKDGLYAYQKMIGLLFIATVFAFYIDRYSNIGTGIMIPFSNWEISLAWAFIPFTVFVLIAVTNAVNITDGLDGLAAGVTIIVALFFALASIIGVGFELKSTLGLLNENRYDYVSIFCSILAGGCMGFLFYNRYPARVFMGDTGSLALGGAIGASAIVMKMPLILVIAGGIYVIETLSVIIQVTSFKLRGKRVFKMAPIHHHFELSGWKETGVVKLFVLITIVLCIASLAALRIRFF